MTRASLQRAALAALAAVVLLGAAPAARPKKTTPILPFIHDDYRAALERARASKLPIFVESWAPW